MSSLSKPQCSTESESSLNLDLSLGGLFSRAKSLPFDERASFSLDNLAATSGHSKKLKAFPDHAVCMLPDKRRKSVSRRRKAVESGEIVQRKRVREPEEPSFTDRGPSSACSFSARSNYSCDAHSNLPSLRWDHQKTLVSEEEGGIEKDSMPSTESEQNLPDTGKPIRREVACGWGHSLQSGGVSTAACTSCVHGQASPHLCSTPSGFAPTRQNSYCPSTASHIITNPAALPSLTVPMLASASDALLINDMLREPRRGEESGRSSSSTSVEMLEREDELVNQLITRKKVTKLEAPRSRCGSNSDIVGSMGVSAATVNTSSVLHTHSVTIPSVQQALVSAFPAQWCYPLSHPRHYPFHIMAPTSDQNESSLIYPLRPSFAAADHPPKNVSLPFPIPITVPPDPVLPEASCSEGKPPNKQDTACEEDAVTSRLALGRQALERNASWSQLLPQEKELSSITGHGNLSKTVSDVCTSGAPSACLLISTSPSVRDPSDLDTRPIVLQPLGAPPPRLLISTSPSVSDPSDFDTRPIVLQPSLSSTSSPVIESKVHVAGITPKVQEDMQKLQPVNEVPCSPSWLTACSNSKSAAGMSPQRISHTQGDKSKASSSCLQRSEDACTHLCAQSQHSILSEGKLAKTVRFSCDEREIVRLVSGGKPSKSVRFRSDVKEYVKCSSKEDQLQAMSSGMSSCSHCTDNKVVEKQTILSSERHYNDHGSANTTLPNEKSDQLESSDFKDGTAYGKLAERKLPRVSTTYGGPNGKTIQGVMYITKSKQACLICSCHGTHMSPSEFVQHSGNTDLRNPERNILVTGFSCLKLGV